MYKGSCLCGAVMFYLASEPKAVTHCHCRMCQKQHGAAFSTYASIPKTDLVYVLGKNVLTAFSSSNYVIRKFCCRCGSNVEWSSSERYSEWVSIPITLLDTPFIPKTLKSVHMESRVCWLDMG